MTSLDQIPADQLRAPQPRSNADAVLRLVAALEGIDDHLPVDQLTHALQTATRAERAGASEELVVAALCHDMAKVLPHTDHAGLGAELLRPFVHDDTYWILRTHTAFQRRYFGRHEEGMPEARARYRRASWYSAAERFSDEWDRMSFDPGYDTLPLEHFAPVVAVVCATARQPEPARWRAWAGQVPGAKRAVRAVRDRLR